MDKSLDDLIDGYIANQRIVGAVVIAAKAGKIIYHSARGLSDRENGIKIKEDDQFRYASLSKVFTHSAIFRLMDIGLITPEQNVRDFLPDFKPPLKNGDIPIITIGNLLSHTAGLDYDFAQEINGPYYKNGISNGLDQSKITLKENLDRISKTPLSYPPGQGCLYSVATDVLGAVIEKITNKKLSDAINDLINTPLGLTTPAFSGTRNEIINAYYNSEPRPLLMNGVTEIKSLNNAVRFDSNRIFDKNAFQSGGAGMKGNAQDFLKLLEAIRFGDFISQKTRDLAIKPVTENTPEILKSGWGFSYLFSNLIYPAKANLKFSKNTISWGGAYGHSWLIDFKNELSLVILTNTAFEGVSGKFKEDIFKYASENFI